MCTYGCLPSRLLASCTQTAMEVQVRVFSMLVALIDVAGGGGGGGGSPVYWATMRADTLL